MKKILLLFAICQLFFVGCKKGDKADPFVNEAPNFNEIKSLESQMTANPISVSTMGAQVLPNGTLVVYKTNNGEFGKLKIVQVDLEVSQYLLIDILTFDASGNVKVSKKNLKVDKGYSCDLSTGVTYNGIDKDFLWFNDLSSQKIVPKGTAVFKKY